MLAKLGKAVLAFYRWYWIAYTVFGASWFVHLAQGTPHPGVNTFTAIIYAACVALFAWSAGFERERDRRIAEKTRLLAQIDRLSTQALTVDREMAEYYAGFLSHVADELGVPHDEMIAAMERARAVARGAGAVKQ